VNSPPDQSKPQVRVAYLLSRYPAISHTFILREILGLRRLGIHIETASINGPDRAPERMDESERAEVAATYYVKTAAGAVKVAELIVAHPVVAMRGLRGALKLGGGVGARAMAIAYWGEAMLVGAWMREHKLEHVHTHFGDGVSTVGMLTAAAWGGTWSMTIHGPREFLGGEEIYLARKIGAARFVIAISDFGQRSLRAMVGAEDGGKIVVSRLGVDVKRFAREVRGETGGASDGVNILCVGRLVREKGQRELLQAVAELNEQGKKMRVTLAGAGPERDELERFCRANGLEQTVKLVGATTAAETLELLREADIFVLASYAEGLPVALMEAMAMEVPCVSTRIAGIPELIADGREGLLVEAGDVDGLRDALARLMDDAALRREMGTRARARVMSEYELDASVARLAKIYEQQVGAHEA
jgi:glycosyltransferase involved in cell wall biosynthesis